MDLRGFSDAAQMNEEMIARWNDRVRKKDEVVVLGDLSVGSAQETADILERLNGRIYMIRGNHDRFLDRKEYAEYFEKRFVWIRDYATMHDAGRTVILSHYPILCYNGQYRLDKKGRPRTYMLYGHVHDTVDEALVAAAEKRARHTLRQMAPEAEPAPIPCRLINCFCMYADYAPQTLDTWIKITEERRYGGEVDRPGHGPDGA